MKILINMMKNIEKLMLYKNYVTSYIKVNIATDFSETPGARHRKDGLFSGQEFFEEILEPKFIKLKDTRFKLLINLDGTNGYAASFLKGSFGELAIKYGKTKVLSSIDFISNEEPYLIEEIKSYMN